MNYLLFHSETSLKQLIWFLGRQGDEQQEQIPASAETTGLTGDSMCQNDFIGNANQRKMIINTEKNRKLW